MAKTGSETEQFKPDYLPEPDTTIPSPIVPIEGGALLESGELKSPNFVTTKQGWSLNSDGSAEFRDITATGVNVDFLFTAGEALTYGDAVGLYGSITRTDTILTANQATIVDVNVPTTNKDGISPLTVVNNGADDRHVLLSWAAILAEPSGTGITILTREIRFSLDITQGSAADLNWYYNTASFVEGTVTWNTKPTSTIGTNPIIVAGGGGGGSPFVSAWLTVTQTELNNIRTNGVTLIKGDSATGYDISDEDQAIPPKIEVRYTYKVRNGSIYKVKATTAELASSFMGLALKTVAINDIVNVRTEGIIEDLTGLTAYSTYYLSDTVGSISTSAGTVSKIVGRALSTTTFQVKNQVT